MYVFRLGKPSLSYSLASGSVRIRVWEIWMHANEGYRFMRPVNHWTMIPLEGMR